MPRRTCRSVSPVPALRFERDPVPQVRPKSQKMALGSITYGADQAESLGVLRKDNSMP